MEEKLNLIEENLEQRVTLGKQIVSLREEVVNLKEQLLRVRTSESQLKLELEKRLILKCECVHLHRDEIQLHQECKPAIDLVTSSLSSDYIYRKSKYHSIGLGSFLGNNFLISDCKVLIGTLTLAQDGSLVVETRGDTPVKRNLSLSIDERRVFHFQDSRGDEPLIIPKKIMKFYVEQYPRSIIGVELVVGEKIKMEMDV